VFTQSFERAKKTKVSYSFQQMYDFSSELDFAQGHMVLCICIKKLVDKLRPITRFLRFLSSRPGTMRAGRYGSGLRFFYLLLTLKNVQQQVQ
jgi:hypothetical protein